MAKLFLLGMEHECAQRVPDKPLRPFGDTCLFDIYREKLEAFATGDVPGENPFWDAGVALWPGDKRLVEKLSASPLTMIERDEASRNAHNDLATQFNFLQGIDCDWFLWPNGCAPFLTVEAILDMAQWFHRHAPTPMTTVRERRGWIWTENGRPLNHHAGSTQETEAYYESTYNVHIFNKHDIAKFGHYWYKKAQMYVMRDEVETMDIDTMKDFKACEEEWKRRHG